MGIMRELALAALLGTVLQARDRGFGREGEADRRRDLDVLEGQAAPLIEVDRWVRGEAVALKDLRGRVVLLQFCGWWCGPCRGSLRVLRGLLERFRQPGLEIWTILSPRAAEEAAEFLREAPVPWRVAVDRRGATAGRYRVDSCPDYYLVDRKGVLRFADLSNREVPRAVEFLLSEK